MRKTCKRLANRKFKLKSKEDKIRCLFSLNYILDNGSDVIKSSKLNREIKNINNEDIYLYMDLLYRSLVNDRVIKELGYIENYELKFNRNKVLQLIRDSITKNINITNINQHSFVNEYKSKKIKRNVKLDELINNYLVYNNSTSKYKTYQSDTQRLLNYLSRNNLFKTNLKKSILDDIVSPSACSSMSDISNLKDDKGEYSK